VLFFTGLGAFAMIESPSNLDFASTSLRRAVVQSARQIKTNSIAGEVKKTRRLRSCGFAAWVSSNEGPLKF